MARTLGFALLTASIALASPSRGEDVPKEDQPAWRVYCDRAMDAYRVTTADLESKPFQRIKDPVMQHHQASGTNQHGLVYLWTRDDGRPVVVISAILQGRPGQWNELHEFHSLQEEPLVARRGETTAFSPHGPGLKWETIPDSPSPAETALRLGFQARALARRFKAWENETKKGRVELRILDKPIHEYSFEDEGRLQYGALFACCEETDPEALLQLETRPNAEGKLQWHFAGAGYTNAGTHLVLDDVEVWQDDPADFSDVHRGYFIRRGFALEGEEPAP